MAMNGKLKHKEKSTKYKVGIAYGDEFGNVFPLRTHFLRTLFFVLYALFFGLESPPHLKIKKLKRINPTT
jgi:hypothetical protein